MQIERLIGILITLARSEMVTGSQLSTKYGVSIRTIQRDLDTLSLAGVPVYAEPGRYGGYKLIEGFKLDDLQYSDKESALIRQLLSGLQGFIVDSKFGDLDVAKKALNQTMPDSLSIDFTSWIEANHVKETAKKIHDAIEERRVISIIYISKSEETSRKVEPHQLVYKEMAWYMLGYCTLRKGFRYFKLSRIKEVHKHKESFVLKPIETSKPFKLKMKTAEPVTLRLKPKSMHYLLEYFQLPDITTHQDYVQVQTNYPIDSWLISILMKHSDDIIEIHPDKLRQNLKQTAMDLLKCLDS